MQYLLLLLIVPVLFTFKTTRDLCNISWLETQRVLTKVFNRKIVPLAFIVPTLILVFLLIMASAIFIIIFGWGGHWGVLFSLAALYTLRKAKGLWIFVIPILAISLIKILCPSAFNGAIRDINEISKKSALLSIAKHSQDITKTGVRAIIKDKTTLILEDESEEKLLPGTKMLVTPGKTRQRENSEEEIWVTLPNDEGVFLEGTSGWLPVSRLIYTNGELIDKAQLTTKIHFIPNTWSEVNLGKQKINLHPGNYEVESITGGYEQRFLNITTKKEEYFSIGTSGIYHNIKEIRDHLPLPEINFGTPIIFIGNDIYPIKKGLFLTVSPEDEVFISANVSQNWSHIGKDSSMSFVRNKGRGFNIEFTLKP